MASEVSPSIVVEMFKDVEVSSLHFCVDAVSKKYLHSMRDYVV